MIVPDVNLLLYAELDAFAEHARARRWWERALSSGDEVGLATPAVFGFIRVSTNPRIFTVPLEVAAAVERVERWLERPSARFLLPGPRNLEIAFRLLRKLGTAANLTTDVQLAALAIEYQAELCSNDTDFGRFPQLRWVDPLGDEP